MPSKRPSHRKGNDDRDPQVPGKRRHGDTEQAETSTEGQCRNEIEKYLERSFRKVVQEVVPPIFQRYLSPCCGLALDRPGTSGGRALQLRFMNKLPTTVFTDSKITAEDGAPLRIALFDATYQNCIVNEGPLSSMRIPICVLDGDFGSNGNEDWTADEFNARTLRERERKRPLLNGKGFITLENGIGFITNIEITDNSSWTRSGKFRLGVKIAQPTSIEVDIREGRSEPFVVKDKRGESYMKHDRPSLNDEIWRLKQIAKNGITHKQLASHGIKTVKDLLQWYITNQTSLREIIGNTARKSLGKIIEHAKTCPIDDGERYFSCYREAEKSITLVFNCIYEVVEVSFNRQNYVSLEYLNLEEKGLVERVKQHAYKNLKDLTPFETSTHGLVKTLAGAQARQCGLVDQGLQQFDLPIAQQGQQETWPYLDQPSTSTQQIGESAYSDQIGTDQLPELGDVPLNRSAGGEFTIASYLSTPTSWDPVDPLYLPYSYEVDDSSFPNSAVDISSKGKRKTVWYKIRSALKWVILHAAKRKAKIFHYQY